MIQTDVIIVGGGPAGSACAGRLKQHGIDCLVLDQVPFPRFKPCAGWITPDVVKDLRLQPGEYPGGFLTFRTMWLHIGGLRVRLSTRQYAIRRYEFDRWLLQRSGAPFYVHPVKSIVQDSTGYVVDGEYCSKYLVGAGGTYCPVYRTIFKADNPKDRGALIAAQEEEFPYPHASEDCWLWFWKGLPGYAWYVPKANGYVNVGVGALAEKLTDSGDSLKNHWQALIAKLAETRLVGSDHSYKPSAHSYYLRQRLPQVRKDNAFLAGDAAGLATLDLGEGIGPAIRSGLLAAEAIATGRDYSLASIPRYSFRSILSSAFLPLSHRD